MAATAAAAAAVAAAMLLASGCVLLTSCFLVVGLLPVINFGWKYRLAGLEFSCLVLEKDFKSGDIN